MDQFIKWAEAKRQAARTICEESEESSDDLCEIISSTDREQGRTSTYNALDSEALIPRSMASSSAVLHVLCKEDEEDSDDLCEIISGTDHKQGHTSTCDVLDSEASIPRSVASSCARGKAALVATVPWIPKLQYLGAWPAPMPWSMCFARRTRRMRMRV